MKWHLKKSDGTVFGPVELAALKKWAAEGRIAAEDLLSTDGVTWSPAPGLDVLKMDWMVRLDDGQMSGPLHLLSLCEHVRDGLLSKEARVTDKKNGKERALGDALLNDLLDDYLRMMEERNDLARRLGELGGRPLAEPSAPHPAPAGSGASHPGGTPDRHRKDRLIEKWKRMYEEECENSRKQAELLNLRIQDLQQNLKKDESALLSAQRRLAQAEKKLEAFQQNAGESAEGRAALLLADHTTLEQNYETLLKEAEAKREEIIFLRQEQETLQSRLAASQRMALEDSGKSRQEIISLRRRLEDLEEAHTQLLQSFRELHSRLIQSRKPA